jgi:iron complex outermembrane receptor protein
MSSRLTTRRALQWIALSQVGLIATPSFAQEAPQGEDPIAEEIIVTSSRIRRAEEDVSNPVLGVSAEAIRNTGTTSVANFLKEVPALQGSIDANDAAGSNSPIGMTGLSLLNLRNLGEQRTLVLVDGRRHVASLPGSSAVDVDTIPMALIERVDIQTGGASAIYGADGVSGVVNFVMKKDFEGVDVRAQTGRSFHGDADNHLVSAVAGLNFHDGRGNVALALEHSKDQRLKGTSRNFVGGNGRKIFVDNPDPSGQYAYVPMDDIRYWDSSPHGAIDVDFDFVNDFDGTGAPWDFGNYPSVGGYAPISPSYAQGGSGTKVAGYAGDLLPGIERYTANLLLNYEIAPAAKLFGEVKYSRSKSYSEAQPTFDFFLYIEPDNAYIPQSIADASGGAEVLLSRDNFDLGIRSEDVKRETVRAVVGIGGDITDNIRYETSYVYGETEVANRAGNNRYNDRFAAALDAVVDPATGDVVCRSNLDPTAEPFNIWWQGWDTFDPLPGSWAGSFTPGPNSGCVPLNLFGAGAPSQAAIDWIMVDSLSRSKITQQVFQAFVSGDTDDWFALPAGALGFALGVEWRKEESRSNPPLEDQLGLTFGNVIQPEKGDYDVREVFAEIDLPLLSNMPFAHRLSLDAAYRLSDYSTIGNASTWKVGALWAPIPSVTFRGTIAEATRAPNISELFDPGGQDFRSIADPCDVDHLDEGSSTRAANCAALLNSLGVDPTTFKDTKTSTVAGLLKGNPDLDEEVAETTTIGVLLRPSFAPNLSFSVDWYDIKLTDAITTATPLEAAEICVDSPSLENDFCGLITRDPTTGQINGFTRQPVNVANFRTEGYDFTVNYALDPSEFGASRNLGQFNFRLVGNKLEKITYINLPGAEPDPELGEAERPEWTVNFDLTWQLNNLMVNYGINYFDETYRYTYQQRRSDANLVAPEYAKYDARFTHDVYARYDFDGGLSVYGGVNNVTDQKPDIGATFYPVSAVGRYWFMGLSFAKF